MMQVMRVIIGPIARDPWREKTTESNKWSYVVKHSQKRNDQIEEAPASHQALFEEEKGTLYGPGIADYCFILQFYSKYNFIL